LGLVLLLSASGNAAEHDLPPRTAGNPHRVSLSVSNRAGLVTAPFVTAPFPEVSGFGDLLIGATALKLSSTWLRLRVPISIARLDFPAGAQVAETALGNLELGLERTVDLGPATRVGLLGAALAPSAEHGPRASLLNNRALAIGNALNGGKQAALLTPGVTGLRFGVGVEHLAHPFELRASLAVPLLVRVSDASLPEDAETHTLGMLPALDLKATWWIASWFGASLGGTLITEPWRVMEPARERDRNQRLQPIAESGLHARLVAHITLGLDASIPLGGALGGEVWSIGTHARLGF
jgi:hypothetical protein